MNRFLFLLLLPVAHLFSQNPVLSWVNNFAGPGDQYNKCVAVDPLGNVYTALVFADTVDLDPGPSVYMVSGNMYSDNIAVVKMDASGNFIWGNYIAGKWLQPEGLEVDDVGNIYMGGIFSDTVDFDPGPGSKVMSSPSGEESTFILKLRPNGDLSWAHSFAGASECWEIDLDKNANLFLSGAYKKLVDFDPSIATYTLQTFNTHATYFAKLDSSGNFNWVKEFSGGMYSYGHSILNDTAGFIYINGLYRGTVDFDPSAGVNTLSSINNAQYLAKLDMNGNLLFVKSWDCYVISNVAIDPQNNINLGMTTYSGTIDLDPGPGIYTVTTVSTDFAIVQLNASGNFNWAKRSGGNASMYREICCDKIGNIYATGMFSGLIDLDPGPGTFTAQGVNQGFPGFILNLDPSGSFLWAGVMAVSGPSLSNSFPFTEPLDITADSQGNVYFCGIYNGYICNLDPTGGTYTLGGVFEGFVTKISNCVISAINSPSLLTYCTPGSTTLSALSPGSVSWFTSPNSTNSIASGTSYATPVLTAGNYTYYAEANQCVGKYARTPFVVNVSSYPIIQVNSSLPTICIGETSTIQLSGATTYSINGVASASTFSLAPITTTSLLVVGVNPGNCIDSTLFVQQVAICTNIANEFNLEQLFWPNPALEYLWVKVQVPAIICIYSMSGEKLIEEAVNHEQTIGIADLPKGIFVVEISCENGKIMREKLVKN